MAACCLFLSVARADDAPKVPQEVTLVSGAVLHHVSALRWGKDTVTLKHDGGADPIRYSNMKPDDRAAFEAARDYYLAHPAVTAAPPSDSVTLKGQIHLGGHRLGGVVIYAEPPDAYKLLDTDTEPVHFPAPFTHATTDADGYFTLTVPTDRDYLLYVDAPWMLDRNNPTARWMIKSSAITDPQNVMLDNTNVEHLDSSRPEKQVIIDDK